MVKMKIAMLIASFLFLFTVCDANSDEFHGIPTIPQIRNTIIVGIRGTRSGDTMTDVRIEPFDTIYAHKFIDIWWGNYSDTPINIEFGKGSSCKKISHVERVQFWSLGKECHITGEPIPKNGTLKMRFDDGGTYPFEIQFMGTNSTKEGKLILN